MDNRTDLAEEARTLPPPWWDRRDARRVGVDGTEPDPTDYQE